jgi:Flp pilus assembly protein TadD
MAVFAGGSSIIVRNSMIEGRFPGGLESFAAFCPNQTFCTDGNVSRVGFMKTDDAKAFIRQLVTAGLASSVAEARSEIALVQGRGFASPCDWLQVGLFDGRPCAWLAGLDRGSLFIPEGELNSDITAFSAEEFHEHFDFVGVKAKGKIEVYRHKQTGELRYVARPFRSVRKWWQIWKKPREVHVDARNHDEIFVAASDLIKPFINHQLTDAPLSSSARKELERAREMLISVIEFNPGNWTAYWALGIASKCLRDLAASYKAFQEAYKLEKQQPDVARELSGICMALGKGEEAVRISREVVDRNPENAGLISNHALALLIAGLVQEAQTVAESALRLKPEDEITRNLVRYIKAVRANQARRPDRYP